MKKFTKNIALFLIIMLTLLVGIFRFNNGSFKVLKTNESFEKKVQYFNSFIEKNLSVNLILGSSIIEDCLIPDSLGYRWFSFSNNGQNIYESYKFFEFYKNKVKIDTIIIGIQPFDFPFSYTKKLNNDSYLPHNNGYFYIFGIDSITEKKMPKILSKIFIQQKKQALYPNINKYLIDYNHKSTRQPHVSKQGFSGRKNKNAKDIDSLYQYSNYKITDPSLFYSNLSSEPNFKYFDLFNKLAVASGTQVIYLNTPKSKPYFKELIDSGLDRKRLRILNGLKQRNVEFWNYENYTNAINNKLLYWNESHMTFDGAILFTNEIKRRLIVKEN